MKRISKELKAIADRHVQAKAENKWNTKAVSTVQELAQAMKDGHTYPLVLDNVEITYCPIGTLLGEALLGVKSKTYMASIYRGFRLIWGRHM